VGLNAIKYNLTHDSASQIFPTDLDGEFKEVINGCGASELRSEEGDAKPAAGSNHNFSKERIDETKPAGYSKLKTNDKKIIDVKYAGDSKQNSKHADELKGSRGNLKHTEQVTLCAI